MTEQPWAAYVNDDKVLVFTATAAGDISADTFEFTMVDGAGALVLRKTWASGAITISNPGSATTKGVVQVDLTGALTTEAASDYKYQFYRTTAGRVGVQAAGPVSLLPSYKNAT